MAAKAQRWDPAEALRVLLAAEEERSGPLHHREPKGVGLASPTGKTFDVWSPKRSSIPVPTQEALRSLEWIGRRECLVVSGPSGTGKSHFCEALGHAAIDAGMRKPMAVRGELGRPSAGRAHGRQRDDLSCR